MDCSNEITISQGDQTITVQCEQIVPETDPRHERTHSATIVAMSSIVMDGEPHPVSVNVYLVW